MPSGAPLTLYIVRHAEKAAPSGDPPLSAAGVARARGLADALAGAAVRGIIVTTYRRTQETAAPLAAARGIAPAIVPVTGGVEAHARAVVDSARAKVGAGAVLVVGHTNTIPAIITAAGGPAIPEPCEEEYDGLWIVTIPVQGAPTLVRARYGPETPASAECTTTRMKP
jgi:phosphohistidine phosphatase SixA